MKENNHIIDRSMLDSVSGVTTMSAMDEWNWRIFGFESSEELHREFSSAREATAAIGVPFLMIQPADDPLQQVMMHNIHELDGHEMMK